MNRHVQIWDTNIIFFDWPCLLYLPFHATMLEMYIQYILFMWFGLGCPTLLNPLLLASLSSLFWITFSDVFLLPSLDNAQYHPLYIHLWCIWFVSNCIIYMHTIKNCMRCIRSNLCKSPSTLISPEEVIHRKMH